MGIKEDVGFFNQLLDATIDEVMQVEVADIAKEYLRDAVQTEVYDAYDYLRLIYHKGDEEMNIHRRPYQRKGDNGGLTDKHQMEADYNPNEKKLEVYSTRRDTGEGGSGVSGRLIAPVVESGTGYTWEGSLIYEFEHGSEYMDAHPLKRPFHKVAEADMILHGELEQAVSIALKSVGFNVSKGPKDKEVV